MSPIALTFPGSRNLITSGGFGLTNQRNGAMPRLSLAIATAVVLSVAAGAAVGLHSDSAAAQNAALLVNTAEIDIVPGKMDQFLAALKENAAAAVKEAGCREFDVVVSKNDPNHILTFVVFDSPAALEAHRKTDAYKKFRTVTKGMIAKNANQQFTSIAMNSKGM
jgi:(4S)-4-hydroxy-5-phosphonooxypentane-2,3-dione isomerase